MLFAASNVFLGTLAICHRYAVQVTPFGLTNCTGHEEREEIVLKEGQCEHRSHGIPFDSFTIAPWRLDRKQHNINDKKAPCRVFWYEDKKCKGPSRHTDDLHIPAEFDKCHNATEGSGKDALPRSGRAFRLHCDKPAKPAKPSSKSPATIVANNVHTSIASTGSPSISTVTASCSSCPHLTVVTISSASSTQSSSSTRIATQMVTSTKTFAWSASWKPTLAIVNGTTKTLATASFVKTTTTLAPPVATIEGTTTVYFGPSSSKTPRVETYTAFTTRTFTDAPRPALIERAPLDANLAQAAAEASQASESITPPSLSSVECYISLDGHWYISSCPAAAAVPTATPSIQQSTLKTIAKNLPARNVPATVTGSA
ncbi:hypothetical protein CAC42_7112 [Sphaceloma murrayae]|uniref:Uncharacterized protein n=1 Tax=Sphaceloma murrayae TaxID=2082308 RepID=A0A2K1QR18_9PEZI|nr:hypothetical protein CAC42_7112 [Sphaceloma murrayae]